MAKIIIGTIVFLGTIAWIPFFFVNISNGDYYVEPESFIIPLSILAVALLGISYLFITKFWRKQVPTSKLRKLNYEINLLKKQAELRKLKKELNQKS